MLVLVTGAAGFVGHHLVRRLLDAGHQVRCFVHPKSRGGGLEGLPVEIARGDISDPVAVYTAVAGTDAVIHLVAIIVAKGGATFTGVNVEGTRHVVMACQKAGVKRLIHQSANGAAPNARYPYTYSKWLGEEAVRSSGLDYTILRPSVIYGAGDQFLNRMAGIARMTPIVPIIGTGKWRFQPIWVEDVCTCLSKALDDHKTVGQSHTIGGPAILTYEEVMDLLLATLGLRRWKLHVPIALMKPAAFLMDKLLPNPPLTPGQLDLLKVDNTTDLDSVERHFGFKPASLREKIDYVHRKP